jgi:sortase family protein
MGAFARIISGSAVALAVLGASACSATTSHHIAERSATSTTAVIPTSVSRPPDRGAFSLVVHTRRGNIPATVVPISVSSNQVVDPPHATPQQWNTAAWVRQAAYPAAPSTGTTYIYGHACHHHVCPFTDLKDASLGDAVVVTTPTGVLNYGITRIGLSSRSARSLPNWASDSTVTNRIVLVTCEYELGDTSVNNIVVVASLNSPAPTTAP